MQSINSHDKFHVQKPHAGGRVVYGVPSVTKEPRFESTPTHVYPSDLLISSSIVSCVSSIAF